MNVQEFYDNVLTMMKELEEKGIDFSQVKISYTRASGENIIAAMDDDCNIHSYFKW